MRRDPRHMGFPLHPHLAQAAGNLCNQRFSIAFGEGALAQVFARARLNNDDAIATQINVGASIALDYQNTVGNCDSAEFGQKHEAIFPLCGEFLCPQDQLPLFPQRDETLTRKIPQGDSAKSYSGATYAVRPGAEHRA